MLIGLLMRLKKVEDNMFFHFENSKKDINMTQEIEDYRKNNICRFCEKTIESDRVRDHCHLTRKYRGPAHNICNTNITHDQSNFLPFNFLKLSNYDYHPFFKKLVDEKSDEVKFKF